MRIHHVAFRTADLGRLQAFYVEVLGLPISSRGGTGGRSVWLELGDAVLMLERAEDSEPAIPAETRELLAFAVEDLETWRGRIERAGVRIEAETANTLYFRDPDGRRLAVSVYRLC
jgi:catechol 2,3-dioxygenase-like lactoylglutathione lyase family enzyme